MVSLKLIVFCLLLNACKSTDEEAKPVAPPAIQATVASEWMDVFLEIERYAPGFRPPVAARALAYINLAAYEAIIPYSTQYQSIAPKFSGLVIPKIETGKTYNYEVVVNEVYYNMLNHFFPHVENSYKTLIEKQYTKLATSTINATDLVRSKQFGAAMATAIFNYSKTDISGNEGYLKNQPTDYVPPIGPGKWVPTSPDFSRALLPYWGKTRTFVASEADKLALKPLAYGSSLTSPMFAQGLEVYTTTTSLTYENQWIAEFWSDDIYKLSFEPAGRWLAIALQVVRKEKAPLDKAIYTYAKLGIGLSDVGVACWNSKYIYNIERPISYIQKAIDTKWVSKLNNPLSNSKGITPPFPAYPSGHSCFGGVAAEILTNIYGSTYTMTDRCHEGRLEFIGTPRSFNNFYEMATENAYSRIPLGVHYRMDCEEGLRMGYSIGRKVNLFGWTK